MASSVETPKENKDEQAYLDLLKEILTQAKPRSERTGTGTLALFGKRLEFDLSDGTFPLLTTKRVFYRGVFEELLWMLRGCTDSKKLSEKGVKIWDGNGTREFLDKRGLKDNREGDLGPVYGFQWRHWGANYDGADFDHTGKGVDQIMRIIETIKNNPTDRRMILSAWNVGDLDKMALPPCHMFCQFFVDPETKELSCMMTQRSCDMGLGVPFNIASYALLTHIIAYATDTKAKRLIMSLGDTHIYLDHVPAIEEQVTRVPLPFPKLKIKEGISNIEDFTFEDFVIVGYDSYAAIKMNMSV